MAARWRFPLACGGDISGVRFHGFFTKNTTQWPVKPLAERTVDVAYFGRAQYTRNKALTAHRHQVSKALAALRENHPDLVVVPQKKMPYSEYLKTLGNTKVGYCTSTAQPHSRHLLFFGGGGGVESAVKSLWGHFLNLR